MPEDQDPTGMRHLLAGLRESGPMPDDLAERIRVSLEDEQRSRSPHPGADDTADAEPGFWTTMDDPAGASPPHRSRRSAGPLLLGAAAATVIALGVGGLVLRDSGPDAASPRTADAPAATSETSAGSTVATDSGSAEKGDVPAFAITASGVDYQRDTLAGKAAALLDDPTSAATASDDRALGTLTTAAGATDCLGRLGQPQMNAVVVDVATFDGTQGLLLIGDSPPDGPAKAWAITSGCEPIWKDPVEVPRK